MTLKFNLSKGSGDMEPTGVMEGQTDGQTKAIPIIPTPLHGGGLKKPSGEYIQVICRISGYDKLPTKFKTRNVAKVHRSPPPQFKPKYLSLTKILI